MKNKIIALCLFSITVSAYAEIVVDTSELNEAVNETVYKSRLARSKRLQARKNSYNSNFVMVSASCVSGLMGTCIADDMEVKGSHFAIINKNSGASVTISSSSGNKSSIAGNYTYNIYLRNGNHKYCSGNFSLNGSENNVSISVYDNSSCDAHISKH